MQIHISTTHWSHLVFSTAILPRILRLAPETWPRSAASLGQVSGASFFDPWPVACASRQHALPLVCVRRGGRPGMEQLRTRPRHDGRDLQLAEQVLEPRDVLVNDLVKTLQLHVDPAADVTKNVMHLLRRCEIGSG